MCGVITHVPQLPSEIIHRDKDFVPCYLWTHYTEEEDLVLWYQWVHSTQRREYTGGVSRLEPSKLCGPAGSCSSREEWETTFTRH